MSDHYRIVGLAGRGAVPAADGAGEPEFEPFLADLNVWTTGADLDLPVLAQAAAEQLRASSPGLRERAESVARVTLEHDGVERVEVRLHRPEMPLGVFVQDVECVIERSRVAAGPAADAATAGQVPAPAPAPVPAPAPEPAPAEADSDPDPVDVDVEVDEAPAPVDGEPAGASLGAHEGDSAPEDVAASAVPWIAAATAAEPAVPTPSWSPVAPPPVEPTPPVDPAASEDAPVDPAPSEDAPVVLGESPSEDVEADGAEEPPAPAATLASGDVLSESAQSTVDGSGQEEPAGAEPGHEEPADAEPADAEPVPAVPPIPEPQTLRGVIAMYAHAPAGAGDLAAALRSLRERDGLEITGVSPLARTVPDGQERRTAVVGVEYLGTRAALADLVASGHRAGVRVEVLSLEGAADEVDGIALPHPDAVRSAAVLVPWSQLDPGATVPGPEGGLVVDLAEVASDRGAVKWLALDWARPADPEPSESAPDD
ncbi:hypothetical protein [Serinibacter salmoneus]|uniref:hypothetical protein n=1 Tax=Serinibacter salmoneus TaxID=556530 RepID=UPI000BF9DCA3|nr:hypothetical protein [Serinibacter salmoneus]